MFGCTDITLIYHASRYFKNLHCRQKKKYKIITCQNYSLLPMKAHAVGVCWIRLAETIQTDACSVGFMESYNKLHQRCIDILLISTQEFPKTCTLSEAQLWVYKVRRCTRDAYTCYSDIDDSDACHSLVKFERIKHTKRCMCKVSKIVITENYPCALLVFSWSGPIV